MSDSHSVGLQRLTQADIKKLEKMAQKAKRDEEARSAKVGPPNYAAVSNSVSFDAPIRGSNDDNESKRLCSVLGRWEDMSPIITSGKTGELMGVERQPATPSAKLANNVFSDGFKSNRHSRDSSGGRSSHGGSGQSSRQIERAKMSAIEKAKMSSATKAKLSALSAESSSSSQSKSVKESMKPPSTSSSVDQVKNKGVSNRVDNVTSHSQRSDHKSTDHARGDSASSKGYTKPASSSSNRSSAQPPAKTATTTTDHHHADQKHLPSSKTQLHSREPVLQELGKELTKSSKPSTKHMSSKLQSSRTSDTSIAEVSSKESTKDQTQKSVLQVKEENRNDAVVNGRNRHRPRLQLPEKNVEDMLKELTHVPQPLTAIQTPLKDIKSPFNDHRADVKKPSHKESRPAGSKAPSVAIPNKTVPTRERVIEEIQEKDDTSESEDDDADSSDISLSDDSEPEADVEPHGEEEEEEGEIKSDDEDDADDDDDKVDNGADKSVRTSHHSGDSHSRESHRERSRTKEKSVSVEPVTQQQVPAPGPVSAPGVPAMPVKGQRERMSSSESSGSDSDSSEDGSGSDSDSEVDQEQSAGPPTTATQQSGSVDATASATATTPIGHMSPNGMEPSPSKQRWSLKSYFQPEPQLINISQKPASCEAPASNKSDPDHFDEITDVKRSDNISDENIPSVGHDSVNKPMSADEFSPPAPVDKCVLSPIKSPPPVQSPAKRRPSAIDRSPAAKSNESRSPYQHKPYDSKHKDKKVTPVRPSPEVVETGSKRGRKPKTKTPYFVESSSCESDSEGEANSSHASDSFKKSLPVSPQKSQKTVKLKRDKLLKEKDSVKLKKGGATTPSKSSHCDKTVYNLVAPAVSKPQESIEKILDSFPKETPLSPIPNVPKVSKIQKADLRKAGLEVAPVKPALVPLNGLVSYVDGKPSVVVKLDLSLLQKLLPIDMLKTRPHKHKGSSTPLLEETPKVQKLNTVKDAMPNVISPQKVLENTSHTTGSLESNSRHSKHGSSKDRSTHSTAGHSRSKSHQSESVHVYDKSDSGVPDFDSLPVREAVSHSPSHLSEESSAESSCSDSDMDDDSMNHTSHSRLSAPIDNKKRKVDDPRVDDTKRRKTSSKSPHKALVQESIKKYSEDTGWEERPEVVAAPTNTKRKSSSGSTGGSKRERHSSASSQLSTHSQHSIHSQHSSHGGRDPGAGEGGSRGHSSSRKARRTATPSHEAPSAHNTPAHDVQQQPAATAAVANTAVQNPIKSEPAEPVKENGCASQSCPPDSTTGLKRTHEIFYSADHYHRYAKSFKYQADKMEAGLPKYKLYLESVLYFTQCGYALEKEHMVVEAASMYKDTQKLVIHQFHQFRGHQEPDSPEHKLSVLCLRIQSLVYLKLYQLKKKETLKLKKILEDHNNKSAMTASQQPKPPSAPSPLQTYNWNRSTGTPSPMSPTPSPASVGSVGSVGSDHATPSKMSNGSSSGTGASSNSGGSGASIVPSGSVMIPQRIHTVTQKYFAYTNYLVQAYEQWEQADAAISPEIKDFFGQLDMECGPLTFHSNLMHLVKYVSTALEHLEPPK